MSVLSKLKKIKSEFNLSVEDNPFYIKGFLDTPQDYLNWKNIEEALNSNSHIWQILMPDEQSGMVLDIPESRPYWLPHTIQDKSFLKHHIDAGNTFVITNYSNHNSNTKHITSCIEEVYNVAANIHVYGSKNVFTSFPPHADNPANFIIQTYGETDWVVFDNRISQLLDSYDVGTVDELTPIVEVRLKPGDMLYLPSRIYHCAYPDEPRLSMSIPCMPLGPLNRSGDVLTLDKNYYKLS